MIPGGLLYSNIFFVSLSVLFSEPKNSGGGAKAPLAPLPPNVVPEPDI